MNTATAICSTTISCSLTIRQILSYQPPNRRKIFLPRRLLQYTPDRDLARSQHYQASNTPVPYYVDCNSIITTPTFANFVSLTTSSTRNSATNTPTQSLIDNCHRTMIVNNASHFAILVSSLSDQSSLDPSRSLQISPPSSNKISLYP